MKLLKIYGYQFMNILKLILLSLVTMIMVVIFIVLTPLVCIGGVRDFLSDLGEFIEGLLYL